MFQMTRFASTGGIVLALCAAFAGCSSRTYVSATGSTPSEFTHLFITAQAVWFNENASAGPADSGWVKFPLETPVTIDLVQESNGTLGQLAGDLRLAPGTYNSILVLPVPNLPLTTAATTAAQAAGATYYEEADWVDTGGTTHQVALVLPNPELGIFVPGASLTVPVGSVGAGALSGTSTGTTGSTAITTTTSTTSTTGTTGTSSGESTTTTVSFATNFDANRDLHLFNYNSGAYTGVVLSPSPVASDLATAGGISGTLTLTSLTNITSVSDRVAIQASAELLSSDGTHHVIVATAPVQTDGTFTIYPLPSNSSTPTVYDVVIHGPNIATMLIKNVSVTTSPPSLTPAASTTGSVGTTTVGTPVSLGTFIPTAATSTYTANITPSTTASLPPGAAVTFYQTLPGTGEVPYAIDEVGLDPINLNLQTAEPLSASTIQVGTYASSGSTITLTSATPQEGASKYRVGATAPLYADNVGTAIVAPPAAATTPPTTTTTTTPPSSTADSTVPSPTLTPSNGSATASITANISQASSYAGGELLVSHNGAVIGTAAIGSTTLASGGSVTVSGLPGGSTAQYYLSVIVWDAAGTMTYQSITSPVNLSGGSVTGVAVAID
jgi:Domain of unknown function (DUF4382)